MPQSVRRGAIRKAKVRPCSPHRGAHHAGRQWPAANAAEKWRVTFDRPWRGRRISLKRFTDLGQQRHDPDLAALAGHGDRLAERQGGTRQRQGFADTKPGTIEQQQQRPVALARPFKPRAIANLLGKGDDLMRRLTALKAASALREAGWSMMQEVISPLDMNYETYTDDAIRRFTDACREIGIDP